MQLTAAAVTPPAEHAARRSAGAADAAAADADVIRSRGGEKMRIGLILMLVSLSFCIGCSDSSGPSQPTVIIVYSQTWSPDVTGVDSEYELVPGEEFAPLGKNGATLFKAVLIDSPDWIVVMFDESLVRCGESVSRPPASHLVTVGGESVCLESRSEDNPYREYHLRLKK